MLEHATLLLLAPHPPSTQIVEPATNAPLGFVRPQPRRFWERVFAGVLLEIHEHEDGSLLCTIRRGMLWPYRRHVYDADGRLVGAVRGRHLEDPPGRVFAVRRPNPQGMGEVFLDADGRTLAVLRQEKEGASVAFTEVIASDPFAKMLVLAAAVSF